MSEELKGRSQQLLKLLIERYIEDGQPVGSRTLARSDDLAVSPATIRNLMSDLEEAGFLESPHTSAGRIPTEQGFRFFVDSIVQVSDQSEWEQIQGQDQRISSALDNRLSNKMDAEFNAAARVSGDSGIVSRASQLLSEFTHMAGVVTLPRGEQSGVSQIEFLPLGGKRVLVVLVMQDKQVQNRVIETATEYTRADLEIASNTINYRLQAKELSKVREQVLAEMRAHRSEIDGLLATAIDLAEQVEGEAQTDTDFVLTGQTQLMDFEELTEVEKLKGLFDAFQEKRGILDLLDRSLYGQGVKIFIGHEAQTPALDSVSLVTAPYRNSEGKPVGVLGVIGPTRMAYQSVIPLVDVTARLLGAALKSD